MGYSAVLGSETELLELTTEVGESIILLSLIPQPKNLKIMTIKIKIVIIVGKLQFNIM